jgi:outer membrane protein OmpA-like peptidoglycan-associated protein
MVADETARPRVGRRSVRLVRRVVGPRLKFVPFGLIPVAGLVLLLAFGSTAFARGAVSEVALRTSQKALETSGAASWAIVKTVSGQWVTLAGIPPSKADADKAVAAVRDAKAATLFGQAIPVTRITQDFTWTKIAQPPQQPAATIPPSAPQQQTVAQHAALVCDKIVSNLLDTAVIEFPVASARISDGSFGLLDLVAKAVGGCPGTMRIEGHTDNAGKPEFNQALSLKRAEAVRDALIERGVPADRLTVEGFGSSKPIASNAAESGRDRNRRIEIHPVSPT